MTKRRIVLAVPSVPAPSGNADSMWFYTLAKGLLERGHELDMFVACRTKDELAATKNHFPNNSHAFLAAETPSIQGKIRTLIQPFSYTFSREFREQLARRLEEPFDVLHMEQLWTGWLGMRHRNKSVLNVHFLASLDQSLRGIRYRHAEMGTRKILRQYKQIVTLTDPIKQAVAEQNPRASVKTIPLAMDIEHFPFQAPSTSVPTVGLVGNFRWTPTYNAGKRLVQDLWPYIKDQVPEAKLILVGRNATVMERYTGDPDVEFYADVADVVPYYRKISAFVYAPPRGSGIKVKTLEATSLGTPIVTNQYGIEGLPLNDDEHVLLAQSSHEIVEKTVRLLKTPDLQQRLALKARDTVAEHCATNRVLDLWESVYNQI